MASAAQRWDRDAAITAPPAVTPDAGAAGLPQPAGCKRTKAARIHLSSSRMRVSSSRTSPTPPPEEWVYTRKRCAGDEEPATRAWSAWGVVPPQPLSLETPPIVPLVQWMRALTSESRKGLFAFLLTMTESFATPALAFAAASSRFDMPRNNFIWMRSLGLQRFDPTEAARLFANAFVQLPAAQGMATHRLHTPTPEPHSPPEST
jgi:hypothetical protein